MSTLKEMVGAGTPTPGAMVLAGATLTTPVTFTGKALAMREDALTHAIVVEQVTNPQEQQDAVQAQFRLKECVKMVKDQIQVEVDRVNAYKNQLWGARDQFLIEVEPELTRVSTMIGDFQALEQAKVRAAEQARNEALLEMDRAKAREIQQATSLDQIDAIQAEYCDKAQALPTQFDPAKAKGQVVRDDWDVTVTDPWLLARAHPGCVKIEPLIGQIKALLKAGVKVAGIVAEPKVKSDVRLGRAIEV